MNMFACMKQKKTKLIHREEACDNCQSTTKVNLVMNEKKKDEASVTSVPY